jgi:hypothetical protein
MPRSRSSPPSPWPPVELLLRDAETLERLSQPEPKQLPLPLAVADTRAARIARILGTVPGVVTADKLERSLNGLRGADGMSDQQQAPPSPSLGPSENSIFWTASTAVGDFVCLS